MDKETYLILRVSGVQGGTPESFSESVWRSHKSLEVVGEVEYRVETQELDAKEFREARRDRNVKAIARPMPLRLIEPVAATGPAAEPEPIHDATWGVYVTG